MKNERTHLEIVRERIARTHEAEAIRRVQNKPESIRSISPNLIESQVRKSLAKSGIDYNPSTLGYEHRITAMLPTDDVEIQSDGSMVPVRVRVTAGRDGSSVVRETRSPGSGEVRVVVEDDRLPIKSATVPYAVLQIGEKQIKVGVSPKHREVWKMMLESLGWIHASIVYTSVRKWLYREKIGCPQIAEHILSDITTKVLGWRTARGIEEGKHGGAIRVIAKRRTADWARTNARQTKMSNPYSSTRVTGSGMLQVIKSPASLAYNRSGTTRYPEWREIEKNLDALNLTETEKAITNMLARGCKPEGIAEHLGVTHVAVRVAIHRMREKDRKGKPVEELKGGLDHKFEPVGE